VPVPSEAENVNVTAEVEIADTLGTIVAEDVVIWHAGAVLKAVAKVTVQAVTEPPPIIRVPALSVEDAEALPFGVLPHVETAGAAPPYRT
jgi:hypothetical protein